MIQTALRVVLAASVVIVGGIGMSMVTAQANASDTYVHTVGPLMQDSSGQICIEQTASGVNKVTVTDSTMYNTQFFHYDTLEDIRIDVPKLHLDHVVLYTNGSNPLVDTLASLTTTTGQPFCTPPGMDVACTITLDEYNLSTSVRTPKGLDVVGGPTAAADPPRPRDSVTDFVEDGCVSADLLNNSSTSPVPRLPVDPTNGTLNETLDNATDTVNSTTKLVNGTVANTTAPVDEAVNGTVTNSTDAVDEPVNNTTAQADDTVSNVTDEANGTETPVEEIVQTTVETVQATVAEAVDTVTNATNVSNDTTAEPTEVPTVTASGSDGGALSVAAWAASHV